MEASMAERSKATTTAVWIVIGLLAFSMIGFGAAGLSGNLRSIGSVGDKEITVNQYAGALQNQLRQLSQQTGQPITFAQAQAFGIDQAVLGQLIAQRALDHETAELGISIGDERVREQVLSVPAFQGLDGTFDREAYRFALQQNGQSERDFEIQIREDAARTLVQGAIAGGVQVSDTYTDTLVTFLTQRRNFTWARLDQNSLETPIGDPTEADLQTYYDENIADFTLPERKAITYAQLTPDMILDTVEIDETALRALYDERIDQFIQAERRLVERLVFGTNEEAEAAKASIETGELTFDQVVQDRGLSLNDIDLGDVTEAELGAAGPAVFNVEGTAVVGPFPTDLGPALFRMNAILQAQETSFEDAQAELREELANDRARRVIQSEVSNIDDLLAGGATLEEVVGETDMELGTLEWSADVANGIAGYTAFRDAAAGVTADDFPEIAELEDGGIFALRLDSTLPPAPQPLADVRQAVEDGWRRGQTEAQLQNLAEAALPALETGGSFISQGLTGQFESDITRRDFIDGTPPGFVEAVFGLEAGEVTIVQDFGTILLVRLNEIVAPDTEAPDYQAIRDAIVAQTENSIAQDLLSAYTTDVQSRAGLELDQSAINAIHAQFQF
jgi:peptidyl-prolyl cis-trans isomerase D